MRKVPIDGILSTKPVARVSTEKSNPPKIEFVSPNSVKKRKLPYVLASSLGIIIVGGAIASYVFIIRPNLGETSTSLQAAAQNTNPPAQDNPPQATSTQTTPPLSTPSAAEVKSAELQAALSSFVKTQKSPYYIVVKDLKTGATASVNPDRTVAAASLYKLFLAQQIYVLSDQGKVSLSSTLAGTGQSYTNCIKKMITYSDNPCGHALGEYFGWGKLNTTLKSQGYSKTDLSGTPKTTANDVAKYFEHIYTSKFLKNSSSATLLGYLKAQQLNSALPPGLPKGTVFAHKTGDLNGYIHDGGIVYGPKSNYIIVAMSGPWSSKAAANASQTKLSSLVYNILEK